MMAGGRRRIVFSATGTRGDALPFIAIAGEMVRRGYECHLLGNAPVEVETQACGVEFVRVAPPQVNNLAPLKDNLEKYHFASYAPSREFFSRIDLSSPTLIANVSNLSPTSILAERYGIPICRLYLAPYHIQSLISPPYPMKGGAVGPMGHTFLKYKLPKIYEEWDTFPFAIQRINEYRIGLGLEPIRLARHAEQFITRYIGLFPSWFAERAADWSEKLVTTGFPLTPARGSLPREVEAFIEAAGKPLVFTPGTGVTDVEVFFREAAACCRALGMPALFLSPHAENRVDYGATILVRDYVNLEVLLPKARLIVHHGGIGTAARALEAGVPQIVSPVAYDQPDNGQRILALRVGAVLKRPELTGSSLAELISTLLSEAAIGSRLAELAQRVRCYDALATTADQLEACFSSIEGWRPAGSGAQRSAPVSARARDWLGDTSGADV